MVTPYFTGIRKSILESLDSAVEEIFVAVYWFTNHQLFEKLCDKLKNGTKVSLIIHNDYINNREAGLNFQEFINLGGQFFFSTTDNPMHNKFCVIDNKILINGSYNWTYFAETKNSENILVIKDESNAIEAFRKEFLDLTEQLKRIEKVQKLTQFEVDEFNGLSARDYLANDIVYQAKATNRPEMLDTAFKLSPGNIRVQEIAVQLDLTKKRKLKCSVGAGILNNKYLIGVKKGTTIPISLSTIVRTIEDNQQNCGSTLYYGDNEKASLNKEMGKVLVTYLPPKPAGEAELKFIFTIDIYGKLRVQFFSLDNGRSDVTTIDVNGLLAEVDSIEETN